MTESMGQVPTRKPLYEHKCKLRCVEELGKLFERHKASDPDLLAFRSSYHTCNSTMIMLLSES